MPNITENIAKNITLLRKQNKWTQGDLADRLNYSFKSISKWERGESTPDIEMLCKVAELFNVDVDYLTKEHSESEIKKLDDSSHLFVRNLLILIMGCVTAIIIATIVFVYPTMRNIENAKRFWVAYLYALPVCALLCYIYACKTKVWLMRMISVSAFVWSLIASLYCTALNHQMYTFWMLFLVGVPVQAAICLYFFWKKTF